VTPSLRRSAGSLPRCALEPDAPEPALAGDAMHAAAHGLTWLASNLAERAPALLVVDDVNTGDGVFTAHGDFAGTVLGSKPGTARLTLRARVTDLHVIEGRFLVSRGTDGLAGARVVCTFRYVVGEGGSYKGLVRLGER
jgi:hypothetical protein